MINELTAEQTAKMPEYAKKWTAIGLCTDPIDRAGVRGIIDKVYKCAGLEPPKDIIIVDSPAEGGRKCRELVGDPEADVFSNACYGQHDANWLAFYRFFRDECGLVKETEKLEGLWEAAVLGWFWCLDDTAIVVDRPSKILLDENATLHCETGPAMVYSDGWSLYRWHGVKVPEVVIMNPKSITCDMVAKEENQEVRRIMIERFDGAKDAAEGISSYIEAASPKVLDTDMSEHNGMRTLLDLGFEDSYMLCCTCPSTGKTFFLDTPRDVTTCVEANEFLDNARGGEQVGRT